jgi:hypothetical protein
MAKLPTALAAPIAMAILAIGTVPALAGEASRTVVVRVHNLSDVRPAILTQAQRIAARIYASIGIEIVWISNHRDVAAATAAVQLDVMLLSEKRTQSLFRGKPAPKGVLGYAPLHSGIVYLFYGRIAPLAASGGPLQSILGRALAHEIGHHLLPAHGHSETGIMRAELDYRAPHDPLFTVDQQEAIQRLLADARS